MGLGTAKIQGNPLQKAVGELAELNNNFGIPVVVEGIRDEKALRNLDLTGVIYKVAGKPLPVIVEELGAFREVVMLTDFDREGESLCSRITAHLQRNGVRANLILRGKIRKNAFARQIQGLKVIENGKNSYYDRKIHGELQVRGGRGHREAGPSGRYIRPDRGPAW